MLSTIMQDKLIAGTNPDTYIQAIAALKPGYFMTPDGETYEREINKSSDDIDRMMDWSKEIIGKCGYSMPIGLVKGSCPEQISDHADRLLETGINGMVFHAGDFLHRGTANEARRARQYADIIKRKDANLLIYGIGGDKNLKRFFFADGFITQSHYINAFNHQEYRSGTWHKSDSPSKELIMKNLAGIYSHVRVLEQQSMYGGLVNWVEDLEETESHTRQAVEKVLAGIGQ
jgi:hypothetical protein